MKSLRRWIMLTTLSFGVLLPSCETKEDPVIVSPWAQYDFTEEELKLLEEAAEYDEEAAHKLGMYYRGVARDKEKQLFWERRMLELHQKNHKNN